MTVAVVGVVWVAASLVVGPLVGRWLRWSSADLLAEDSPAEAAS